MLRRPTARHAVAAFSAILVQLVSFHGSWAAPVAGERFRLPQPDGTWVDVRIWGDEFYGVTESLDGYTVVRDPDTRFLCYAALTSDRDELRSTGIPVSTATPDAFGLVPHVRINQPAARAQARAARARWELEGRLILGRGGHLGGGGAVQGICLIVDFSDDVGTIPAATVSNYCNQVGFSEFGNNGSVRDYFFDVSDGALTYTNYVPAAYYRAAYPKSHYTDPNIPYGQRAQELIVAALTDMEHHSFDFSQYDANGDGVIDAVNCFYAGDVWNNWGEGLWPHASVVSFSADGVRTERYQITNTGAALHLRTFCHENGHMLLSWPDLYDSDYDSTGVGQFCLMAYSTTDTNPCEPCAYLKHIAGWSQTTLLTIPRTGLPLPAASTNRCYKFDRPGHPNEYYLVENRQQTARDSGLPDGGLAIWHVDTLGNSRNNEMTPESHYLVTLVQADGLWDLEHNVNYGDATDLWSAPDYTNCTPLTSPGTNWWNGSPSVLLITNVSTSASVMTFDFAAGSLAAWGAGWCGATEWPHCGQSCIPSSESGFLAVAGGHWHSLGLKADGSVVAWGHNATGQCFVPSPNSDFVALAGGGAHSLGLKSDGSIVAWGAWGDYNFGQCVVPAPNSGFVAVAGGAAHSLGLKADGSIVAWGHNAYDQCVIPPPNSGFVAIAAGSYHSLGLKADGSIVAWGYNGSGACNVPTPNSDFVAVAAQWYHSLGLKADGSIVEWGSVGGGPPPPNTGFVAIAAGALHSLGLRADGSIVAWGGNTYGQCDIPAPNDGFVAIAGGALHSLGLRAVAPESGACCYPDGSCAVTTEDDCAGMWHSAWPDCIVAQCPQPTTAACCYADGSCAVTTETDCTGVWHAEWLDCNVAHCPQLTRACCYADGSCVVTTAADCTAVWHAEWSDCLAAHCPQPGACCFVDGRCEMSNATAPGDCATGGTYLGDGSGCAPNPCPQPRSIVAWGTNWSGQCQVPTPNSDFVAVAAGFEHSLGLKADGSIVGWGDDSYGQSDIPPPNSGFVVIAAGDYHSLGLKADCSIVAWGANWSGQCDVPAPNSGFVAVAAGFEHSLGLKADGSIVAWGANWSGQCDVPAPNSSFVAVAAGDYHNLGLKADGSIVAWGHNTYDQCSVPVPNGDFVAVAASGYHSLGLKADASIVAWGSNWEGQCDVPPPNDGFVAIAAGDYHSLGLKADASIVAWGDNTHGQCNVPAPNSGFVAIAAGGYHSLGLKGAAPEPGACCYPDGSCAVTLETDCTGVWHAEWLDCNVAQCPPPTGACCYSDGTCTVTIEPDCSGVWHAEWANCDLAQCPQPEAACCYPDGTCAVTPEAGCTGVWHAEWANCDVAECPPPTSACCFHDGHCEVLANADCTAAGGLTWTEGLACDPNPCTLMPGDCDGDFDVDIDDFADFVPCFFGPELPLGTGCECFDLDPDTDVDLVDFAAFQRAFTGS
ncbi:MAG: M6 family metalloprotease domain-containing protein [Phycisphaerales bacterium]|nr:M6 family metalloprotease domain-containing protein [Phycisphaerales bacterium]